MDVATVTTSDRSLLHAVRGALSDVDEALLCVAFVQECWRECRGYAYAPAV